MYRHIIWDFDGTLFDTYPVMARAFRDTLATYGADEPADEIATHMLVSASHALSRYSEIYNLPEEFNTAYKTRANEYEETCCEPFLGAPELVRAIYDSGGKNYLCTHRGKSSLHHLDKHGLLAFFGECVTVEYGFERKPSPESVLYLLSKYNIPPDEALMVGDRELDLQSAKNAGIDACFFCPGGEKTSKYADHIITTLDELYDIIDTNSRLKSQEAERMHSM